MKKFICIIALLTTSCSMVDNKVAYEYPPYNKSWQKQEPPKAEPVAAQPKVAMKPIIGKKKPHPKKPAPLPKQISEPAVMSTPEMTLDEAYKFSGTVRRSFSDYPNTISPEENTYLKQLFKLTDRLVIERNRNLKTGVFKTETQIEVLQKLQQLQPPKELAEIHAKIIKAVSLQLEYYKTMTPTSKFNPSDPLVQNSHNELYGAYQLLMAKYASQSDATKYTFYSHLQPACLI